VLTAQAKFAAAASVPEISTSHQIFVMLMLNFL
jgi:hypothetical protein